MGRRLMGVAAGVVIGAAACMAVMPCVDKKTMRSMKRAGRKLRYVAEDAYDNLSGMR
ncbi:YtxH domain-containing protein [uncultured Clostridium sp.]|uniref:YtxH domain-containing protein n=1 Tax=uncultured Clostridium sp. TaxID=59620 RepID=UPI002615D93F|nr:YtxH domain-containing protein [uncultured Clostridium sp.]